MTSLDELLRYEEDQPSPPKEPMSDTRRWLIRVGAVSFIGGLVAYVLLRPAGLDVPYPLIVAILLVVQVLRRALRSTAADPLPPTLRRPATEWPTEDRWSDVPRDGLHVATTRWDTRLAWMRLREGPKQFTRSVQPRMVEIIDERLRVRHGITRQSDPSKARAILGEQLWEFTSAPVTRNISARDIAALIARMEAV